MGRPFRESDARAYLKKLRSELERNPAASTDELASATGASKPTVRKYRRLLQGVSAPRRPRIRFSPRTLRASSPMIRRSAPRQVTEVAVEALAPQPSEARSRSWGTATVEADQGNVTESALRPMEARLSTQISEIERAVNEGHEKQTAGPDVSTELGNMWKEMTGVKDLLYKLVHPTPPAPVSLSASEKRWKGWFSTEDTIHRLGRSTGGVPPDLQWGLSLWRTLNLQSDIVDALTGKPVAGFSPASLLVRYRSQLSGRTPPDF